MIPEAPAPHAPVAEWRAYLKVLTDNGLTVDVDPKAAKPKIIAAIEKATTSDGGDSATDEGQDLQAWLGAENDYLEDVAVWLDAEAHYEDLIAWLTAEQEARAAAEAEQEPTPEVDPQGEVRAHLLVVPG